jgi:hypothetical protein
MDTALKATGWLRATTAIIRCNNNKHIKGAVLRYVQMGLGKIIVVVDGQKDLGATIGFISDVIDLKKVKQVQILTMNTGYSWANALNLGIKAIQLHNVKARMLNEPQIRHIFNVSVEANFNDVHVIEMLHQLNLYSDVGVVGTSFEGKLDGNYFNLGPSYRHPRNTGMMIRLDALAAMYGTFDARCDAYGGMEDIDFILGLIALTGMRYLMLDMKVPLVVGKFYHQPDKQAREEKAMDNIITDWLGHFQKNSEEYCRIEAVIDEMGLRK